jgi:hypothetical protein
MRAFKLAVMSVTVTVTIAVAAGSCSSRDGGVGGSSASGDPFEGFFANPSVGMLELRRADGEGKYRGSMWADVGPFPVEGTRQGEIVRGTVTYGGEAHPLEIESRQGGLVLTESGTRAEGMLRRFKTRQAFEKWMEGQGGFEGRAVDVEK